MTTKQKVEIRAEMMLAWPQTVQWDEDVWRGWWKRLDQLTADEIRRAIQNVAKRGDSFPPGWGVIFYEAYWKCGGRNRILAKIQREEIARVRSDA